MKLKQDKYKKSRGGHSRLLDISCSKCGQHICYYQKDGPGILKRMYLDRIHGIPTSPKQLSCKNCKQILGIKYVYEKEKRPAYMMFAGAVAKKIVSAQTI